jgi:rubrerythrin
MHPMTISNLQSAHAGESQAHMRYLAYGERALRDKFPNVARLFQAIAFAEQVHAGNHFRELRDEKGAAVTTAHAGFGLNTTDSNLDIALGGERFEIDEMYPAYKAVADVQDEKGAQRTFDWAWKAEQTHAALFAEAKSAVEKGQDLAVGSVFICSVCGHTITGEAPERCPVCNATRDKYREYA